MTKDAARYAVTSQRTSARPALGAGRSPRSQRTMRAVFALLLGALVTLWPAYAASAAGPGERILDYSLAYNVRADGVLEGTETITYQFSGSNKRGIIVYYPVRLEYQGSTSQYRLIEFDLLDVTSPTGAPTTVDESDSGVSHLVRIGDKNRTVSGTQKYVLRYEVRGAINDITDGTTPNQQVYLNPIGTHWSIPIDSASATITAPTTALDVRCFKGAYGSKDTCTATAGTTSSFTATGLQPQQGMTIASAYPIGTFANSEPILVNGDPHSGGGIGEGMSPTLAGAISAAGYGFGVLVPVVFGSLMGLAFWRHGRDEQYAGLTPGLLPGVGEPDAPVVRGRSGPVAVQFHPPEGARPGLVGTVIDETANTIDVSATVIDLAVRGFLTIEEIKSGLTQRTDWRLTQLSPPPGERLERYEQIVYDGLFASGSPIELSELKHKFATTLKRAQGSMYDEVVDQGWFRRSPDSTRTLWTVLGFVIVILGAVILFVGTALTRSIDAAAGGRPVPSAIVLGLGVALAGVIVIVLGQRMPAKTARGSAVLAQSWGFKQYLATAEANQIKFEEAQSIFSRYLPYAIVFGVADKWAKTFAEVASAAEAAGQPISMPAWYFFYGTPNFGGFDNIASSMDDFSTLAAGAFTATPGASGGSAFDSGPLSGGFGGGGGFSGGGGFGGGGGGSW